LQDKLQTILDMGKEAVIAAEDAGLRSVSEYLAQGADFVRKTSEAMNDNGGSNGGQAAA
jgi:hypothetical protein